MDFPSNAMLIEHPKFDICLGGGLLYVRDGFGQFF
jgi:hypothetical protein